MIKYLFASPERSARTAMRVACEAELAGVSGAYFRSQKQRKKPGPADQPELSVALWRRSVELTGIDL